MLVIQRPRPVQGMQGMEGWGVGDLLGGIVKVATLPITLPIDLTKAIVTQGIGAAKGVIGTAKDIASSLKPPPPPPPSVSEAFGISSAASLAAPSSSSSNLPLILGGVAVAGLVVALVVVRKKKGRRRR